MEDDKKIKATLIFEILGRPKEHVIATLEQLITTIGSEKNVEVTHKKIHEVKLFENKDKDGNIIHNEAGKELYSTFAEVELEAKTLFILIGICFKYMPAHIEIIEPDEFVINNFDVNLLLNEIAAKIHQYDALAKTAMMQNHILAQKFQEMSQQPGTEKNIQIIEQEKTNSEKPKKSKKQK